MKLLQEARCEVTHRGKSINLRLARRKKPTRMDGQPGDGYTKDDLLAVLSEKKKHTPRQKSTVQAPPKVNLLVDMQAKLQAGKGVGYAKWAKVFNLRQMAQTMNDLTEHGLLDYTDLVQKSKTATVRYNDLSPKIYGGAGSGYSFTQSSEAGF